MCEIQEKSTSFNFYNKKNNNTMKWYQFKEQAAGEKRLLLSWYLYKIFGKKILKIIAFFVTIFTFLSSKDLRNFTKKNLSVIYACTNNIQAKPSIKNCFQNALNYSFSLVDRIETFSHKFNPKKIIFNSPQEKEILQTIIQEKEGIFFLCNHIGNIEILRNFIASKEIPQNPHVNIFLDKQHCKTFNSFLEKIEIKTNITLFPVEEIGIETAIELEEKLKKGEVVFIAGDRISQNKPDANIKTPIMGIYANLPFGSFKLAQLMNTKTFFISALKIEKDRYKIHLEKFEFDPNSSKQENLMNLKNKYILFLEKMINTAPLQFYHFYDFFE